MDAGHLMGITDPIEMIGSWTYGDDPCMNEFTTGQINRMRAAAWIYRPALFS